MHLIVESSRGALAHVQALTALQLVSSLSQLVWPGSPSHKLLIPAVCPLTTSFKRIHSKLTLNSIMKNKTQTFGLSVKLPPVIIALTRKVSSVLPLDVDSINENDSVANPDPTPRIASVHKSRFAEVVLVGCWIEAVYYGLLLFTIT